MADGSAPQRNTAKFAHPRRTADGQARAAVGLKALDTLWFNTGTLCNIECANCYILSSPRNDALVYLTVEDVRTYLDEIAELGWPVHEIAFTGGEPFMNPGICTMARMALERGYEVLILTNAMRPMMRRTMRQGIQALAAEFGPRLTLRISLDHYTPDLHDAQRGRRSFEVTLDGMRWLAANNVRLQAAGRTMWGEDEAAARDGFARLFATHGFDIDASDPSALVLFPEMDETVDVPEITTACWGILNKDPGEVMCANTRMVVRRKGADHPVVLSCTLLAYDRQFELGRTLREAARPVPLNHPHCARFCVLGGARCSA